MNRNSKVMSIVAVAVCVVALSVGFAAFSNTLTISSGATVKPNASDFSVSFSKDKFSLVTGTIEPNPYDTVEPIEAPSIEIKEGETTLSGLSATFQAPQGQVMYQDIYFHNNGKYTAYLNGITFKNIEGETVTKKCTPKESTSNPLVTAACDGIWVYIFLGGGEPWTLYDPAIEATGYSQIRSSVDDATIENWVETINYEGAKAKLEPGEGVGMTVGIWYDVSGARADEEFTIEFGDIEFLWESVD